MREYTQQEHESTSTPRQTTILDNHGPNIQQTSESKTNKKSKDDAIDAAKEKKQDIAEFVPVETKTKKKAYNIVSNEILQTAESTPHYSYKKKKKVGLFGSKPSKGFRSLSSITGYHASSSPENFFKKKYESEHLRKAQRKISSGSFERMPKSELYQHIMAQYRKGGIKLKKKKLRRRKHKRQRSKLTRKLK